MKQIKFNINNIPAVLYGEESDKVFLFVHGKCGYKEEAFAFSETATQYGYCVLGIDLSGHGERISEIENFTPEYIVPELKTIYEYISTKYKYFGLRANSIGAYFSMLAFIDCKIDKSLFVSPITDMESLIIGIMQANNINEQELRRLGKIKAASGDLLSWDYLTYVRTHPINNWAHKTSVLYAQNDNMTSERTINAFTVNTGSSLTVMPNGEHWFHTSKQLSFLKNWEENEFRQEELGCCR